MVLVVLISKLYLKKISVIYVDWSYYFFLNCIILANGVIVTVVAYECMFKDEIHIKTSHFLIPFKTMVCQE